jgi:hypothetical protein
MIKRALIAACAIFTIGVTAANAAGVQPVRLAELLEAAGLSAEAETGEPLISGDSDGLAFTAFGFDCEAAGACAEYVFNAYFEIGPDVTIERINDFNDSTVAGRAFIDDQGGANVEHFFVVSSDGEEEITRNAEIWSDVLADFAAFIGFFGDGAGS